jgi:uncharacterized protein
MMNNTHEPLEHYPPQYQKPFEQRTMSPFAVLALCVGMFVVGNIIASGIMFGWAKTNGLDFTEVMKGLSENTPVGTRNFMRGVLLINHIFSFIVPALATAWIVYKSKWLNYFQLRKLPTIGTIGIALAWLIVSLPLVQYAYQLNKMLPLPEWMMQAESSTAGLLEAIIAKENFYEIILNVILIAVIPGIGEELMFRGIVQKQIGRFLKNEHVQVWVAAAIFSAIHMQFQGFFARMVLGALLGYMYVWTRNMWVPIIIHFLNNGVQVVGLYAMNIKPSEMDKVGNLDNIPWYITLILAIASLGMTLFLGKIIKERHENDEKNTTIAEG